MLYISSRDNVLYKQLRRLVHGRSGRVTSRDARGTTVSYDDDDRKANVSGAPHGMSIAVLEGVHLCEDWLRYCGQPQRAIFDVQRLSSAPVLQDMAARIDEQRLVSMDTGLIASISPVAKGQGVIFLVNHAVPVVPERISHACIWLDRIQDPGNVGTLLRTAAAAGIHYAYLSEQCATAWSPRVLRSAQGAHFVMTLYEHVDLLEACQRLTIPLCTTVLSDTSVSLYEGRLPSPCAWVFGNEGQGVDAGLLTRADRRVFIPQDNAVESLNVGVAAGICLFEQRRQQIDGT